MAYIACAVFALPAMGVGLILRRTAAASSAGRARRARRDRRAPSSIRSWSFFARSGALLVLLFVLVHKIGDTLVTAHGTAAAERPAVLERRDRAIRRRVSASGRTSSASSSAASCTARLGDEALGPAEPVAHGACRTFDFRGRSQCSANRTARWPRRIGVRERRERLRWRRRGRVFLGALRRALHGHAVRADLGGVEHRRPRS